MQPYYVIMRLPGEQQAEYILMLPMVPQGRDNMIAWMAARCDGNDYGHLFEFAFSKSDLFLWALSNSGPHQSEPRDLWRAVVIVKPNGFQGDPRQSSGYSNQRLAALRGTALYPRAKRATARIGTCARILYDRTVMGDNLELTLAALFKGREGVAPPTVATASPEKQLAAAQAAETAANHFGKAPAAMTAAADHYSRALQALRAGDWTEFGTEMQKLGTALGPPGANH